MLQRLLYGLLLVGIAGFFMGAHPAFADNGHRHRHPRHHYRHGHHQHPKHYSQHRHYGGYYGVPVYKSYGYYRPGHYGYYPPNYGVRIVLPLPPLPHVVFGLYPRW